MSATTDHHDGTNIDLSSTDLRRLLDDGTDVRLLDVRTPGEFAAGHIPGALNIPLDQLRAVADELARPHANTLVLVCQAGGRANSAREILTAAGGKKLVVLEGGMTAWNGAGGASRSREGRWTLERQVRLVAGTMVLAGVVLSTVWSPAKYFSGMVGAGLAFAAITNTCAMGLLLGKLPYNRGRSCDIDSAICNLTN